MKIDKYMTRTLKIKCTCYGIDILKRFLELNKFDIPKYEMLKDIKENKR